MSLLFALLVKLPVRVILYARCALSGVGIRHLLPLENLKLESSGDVDSLGSAGPSSLPSGMEMRMPYDAYGRGDIVTASLQVRAVPLRWELLPCRSLTDGWAGQDNHSNCDLHLPKASDLPDHYPLVTSSSWSLPVWVSVSTHVRLLESGKSQINYSQSIHVFVGIAKYSFYGQDHLVSPITGVTFAQEIKAKCANTVVFLSEKLLSFAAHSTDIQCGGLNNTGGGTWRQIDNHK